MPVSLFIQARAIWQAAVEAVGPQELVQQAMQSPDLFEELRRAPRILVLGGGKAGRSMAAGVEISLADMLEKVTGLLNVPASLGGNLRKIRLHPARPDGSNHPTLEGVAGTEIMLRLAREAGPEDVGLCLLSGGGSALLPAPAPGLTLAAKLAVNKLLHASGATINEMNAVRKHLSAFKGGRLAQAFAGRALHSLIVSDVIGDPLDVIASGPTAADPTTFAEALAVIDRYHLRGQMPEEVLRHLERGMAGELPETLKSLPEKVHNLVIGNNGKALAAAAQHARSLGFQVLNLGAYLEGESRQQAILQVGLVRSIVEQGVPMPPPVCILSGGETTVTLGSHPGKGGRNQEWVLAFLHKLGEKKMAGVVALSGGTDGEDGPTDAAGAIGHAGTLTRARELGLAPADFLERHDAFPFFAATGDLLHTGLTGTNVMDVRVILIGKSCPSEGNVYSFLSRFSNTPC